MKKVGAKVVAMLVALAMVFSVVPGMAATVEAGNEDWEEEVIWLDVEIEIIDGQPMMVIEGDEESGEEYLFIPLELPETILATSDGQIVELEVKDNFVLVPTEDGMVAVPIEDFCVVMVDGQVMLLAEVNPIKVIAVYKIGKYTFKLARHGAHHTFRWLGRRNHIQLNRYTKGVKGSGKTIFRIPLR